MNETEKCRDLNDYFKRLSYFSQLIAVLIAFLLHQFTEREWLLLQIDLIGVLFLYSFFSLQINGSVSVLFLWSTAKQINIFHYFLSSIEQAQPN